MSHNINTVNGTEPNRASEITQALGDLSDVSVTTAATGEVLRYSGAQWVDAQLSYNDLSNTPTLPSSSDDLTSDHTGVNYTGANTDSITTHLAGIDTALASAGGGGAPTVTPFSPASAYSITNTTTAHQVYLLTPTADIDVTLPSAATAGSGSRYDVKNLASGFSLTLKGQTGDNIDGVAPATGIIIGTQYESLTVISDGSDWFII